MYGCILKCRCFYAVFDMTASGTQFSAVKFKTVIIYKVVKRGVKINDNRVSHPKCQWKFQNFIAFHAIFICHLSYQKAIYHPRLKTLCNNLTFHIIEPKCARNISDLPNTGTLYLNLIFKCLFKQMVHQLG